MRDTFNKFVEKYNRQGDRVTVKSISTKISKKGAPQLHS